MIDKIPNTFERFGFDLNEHVIFALKDIRDNVDILPDSVCEDFYKSILGREPKSILSYIRFVCSFAGKFDGGYAREKGSDCFTFAGRGKRNAIKQSINLKGVNLDCKNYLDLTFKQSIIYCDPPYKNTTGYKTGFFDHNLFYDWCREQSKDNIVFVSEYYMPDDFECIWTGEVKTNFDSGRNKVVHNTVEKLYMIKS